MQEIKETQEGLFIMRWRNFLPMMIAVIIGTNTASIFYQRQQHNSEQIQYNKERADRIAKRHAEEARYYFDMNMLRQELQECKDSK